MKFLQKLGKALMLPVAVLPICGILMGIGYWLCPATMQGGAIEGKVYCTETEKEVARIENGCIFYHSVKILFRKKQGNISFMKSTS